MEDSRPIFFCKRFSYNENALYCLQISQFITFLFQQLPTDEIWYLSELDGRVPARPQGPPMITATPPRLPTDHTDQTAGPQVTPS